jgi:hypothetical protein
MNTSNITAQTAQPKPCSECTCKNFIILSCVLYVFFLVIVLEMHFLQTYLMEIGMERRIARLVKDRTYEEREEWIRKWRVLRKADMVREGVFDGVIWRAVDHRSENARKEREIEEVIVRLPERTAEV